MDWERSYLTLPGWADLDVKHSFTYEEGSSGTLSFAAGMYGTTGDSNLAPKGTIFSMDDSGNLTTIYSFPGQMDGGYPEAPVLGSDGLLYGTAGVIYRLSNATVAVNQILPTSGPSSGSASVTVMGGGFVNNSSVTIGGTSGSEPTDRGLHIPVPVHAATIARHLERRFGDGPGFQSDHGNKNRRLLRRLSRCAPDRFFHDFVEKIFRAGITAGCGGGSYCPDEAVTRAQMAVFLLKAEHGSGYVPPPCAGIFGDVTCPSQFANWIEGLHVEGITAGCGGGNFCPAAPVTRAQMAVFLLKAEHGPGYVPPTCTGVFTDVTCPSAFADWIEQLAAERITGGCGGGNYCPGNPNTRWQMAVFLVKTFHL